jgi:hypothetical protein
MKIGDEIDVRPEGRERWTRCKIDLASSNGKSLALSADEGLPTMQGFMIDMFSKRQVLLLGRADDGVYTDVITGTRFELRSANS